MTALFHPLHSSLPTFEQPHNMPWSTSLPQGILSSPLLSIGTPTASGLLIGYLVNRTFPQDTKKQVTNA